MDMKLLILVLIPCFAVLVEPTTDKILCYYASWAATRPGDGKITPNNLDPNLCTHINYAFIGVNDDGSLAILDNKIDLEMGGFRNLSSLKQVNKNLKVLFSIGGASADTAVLSAIATNQAKRSRMVQSSIEFLQEFNYDGIDLDWEYPLEQDRANFIQLLQEMKEAFKPHGYLLTVAVAAIPTDAAYDVPAMSNILDMINVMTYDFHSSWSGVTQHHSPLYSDSSEGEWQRDNLNANSSITHWILSGAQPEKLAIGVAFYGHSAILRDPNQHGIGAVTNGPAPPGPYTNNMGTLGYNELCEFHRDGQVDWYDVQKIPYLYEGDLWVGFDNRKSAALKAEYAKEHGLGGVMVWSIETDDWYHKCSGKKLLNAINDVIKP